MDEDLPKCAQVADLIALRLRSTVAWLGLRAAIVLCCILAGLPICKAAAEFPRAELSVGMHRIVAEVAANRSQRAQGLMFRKAMESNAGMLFVFDENTVQCMWMRNTLLPLSVAFLDTEGKILNIENMQPQTENSHCSVSPARYALEMNLGWFKQRGIDRGVIIRGIAKQ